MGAEGVLFGLPLSSIVIRKQPSKLHMYKLLSSNNELTILIYNRWEPFVIKMVSKNSRPETAALVAELSVIMRWEHAWLLSQIPNQA